MQQQAHSSAQLRTLLLQPASGQLAGFELGSQLAKAKGRDGVRGQKPGERRKVSAGWHIKEARATGWPKVYKTRIEYMRQDPDRMKSNSDQIISSRPVAYSMA